MDHHFADQSGGVKLNDGRFGAGGPCPPWAKRWDKTEWNERGIVVWHEAAQRLECIRASKALKLLDAARADSGWRTTGIVVMQDGAWFPLPKSVPSKKTRKKQAKEGELPTTEAPTVQQTKSAGKAIEAFRLTTAASIELVEFLSANESALHQIAEVDEQETSERLAQVYELLLKAGHRAKLRELDLSSRPLAWQLDSEQQALICEVPPNRGTVKAGDFLCGWCGCVERPDCFQELSPLFVELVEAVAWVEQEVVKPPPQTEKDEKEPPFELSPAIKRRLKRYWIAPKALEPAHITYRVLIELDRAPVSYKTGEMSFGKKYQYDKKYPDADALGRELKLSPMRLDIEPLKYTGIYRIKSLVTYLDERLAVMQAQQLWEQSAVLEQHKAGNVLCARYGLTEVETDYFRVLGVCGTTEPPWPGPRPRAEYMADKALAYTLAYALDVNSYRAHTRARRKWLSDDDLVHLMHRRRAECQAIPASVRRQSELWLARHASDVADKWG
jgi:hypothetical protein